MANPMAIGAAFFEMTARLMSDPSRLVQAQMSLWNDYMRLWQSTTQRLLGGEAEPVVEPAPDDRRFRDQAWSDNALFDFIKQSYLLTARCAAGRGQARSKGSTTRPRRRSISTRASSSTRWRRRTSC